jgi:hypothetical protein
MFLNAPLIVSASDAEDAAEPSVLGFPVLTPGPNGSLVTGFAQAEGGRVINLTHPTSDERRMLISQSRNTFSSAR